MALRHDASIMARTTILFVENPWTPILAIGKDRDGMQYVIVKRQTIFCYGAGILVTKLVLGTQKKINIDRASTASDPQILSFSDIS